MQMYAYTPELANAEYIILQLHATQYLVSRLL